MHYICGLCNSLCDLVTYLYTAHIPIQFMAVYNSFFLLVGGEIGCQLVKAPLVAAISP